MRINQQVLIDIEIALIFIVLTVIVIITSRTEENIGVIDLTGSEYSCQLNKKHDNYTGFYHVNNQKYFSSHKYQSCDEFIEIMRGKIITGEYLKSNNLLVELRVGKSLYSENSLGMQIFQGIFIGLLFFAILRKPIRWLIAKVA